MRSQLLVNRYKKPIRELKGSNSQDNLMCCKENNRTSLIVKLIFLYETSVRIVESKSAPIGEKKRLCRHCIIIVSGMA